MNPYKWWAGWYATRLHAVHANVHDHAHLVSLCGAWVYGPTHVINRRPGGWRERLLRKGVPHCKRCEAKIRKAAA